VGHSGPTRRLRITYSPGASPSQAALAPAQAEPADLDRCYTLGRGLSEQDRLQRQAAQLRGLSAELLDHVPAHPGSALVDLGCGPTGILDLLASRTGPSGCVVGVELDPAHVASARDFARERGLDNVAIVSADARRTSLPSATFDLVHTRLVLTNMSHPDQVVHEMVRLLKPGGHAAALEVDALGLCYPPHPAWDRLTGLATSAFGCRGADAHVGRRLPELLRGARLTDLGVEARTEVCPPGHPQRTLITDLIDHSRSKVVQTGLTDEAELDFLLTSARRHLAAPDTVVVPVIYFLAWARKP
jgi:SAM-dependent methyltransferase